MIMTPSTIENASYRDQIEAEFEQNSKLGSGWISKIRQAGYKRFVDLDFPVKKNEAWKYIPLEKLLKTPFGLKNPVSINKEIEEKLRPYFVEGYSRLAFVNGNYAPDFSGAASFPKEGAIQNLSSIIGNPPEQLKKEFSFDTGSETNPFASINTFSFQDGAFIYIPDETVVDIPVHLLFAGIGGGEPAAVYPRVFLIAGNGSKVNVILDNIGFENGSLFTDSVVELVLGRNARLDLLYVQREEGAGTQFSQFRCKLREGSNLNFITYSRGGTALRNDVKVDFEGENATADLKTLSLLSGKSKIYQHALVNHAVPHCTSHQISKNILADRAQSEFNSMVHVFPGSVKSDSDQLNRNLLLSETARAWSRPQLKIENDDVQCTHGAATGQMVGDELFYLRSRGIDKLAASFMLTYSFAHEILSTVPVPELRDALEKEVHTELDKVLKSVVPEKMGVV